MEKRFLKIEDKKEWQDLLDKVLFKTFFHSWKWEEFLEKNFKWLRFERYNWQDKALLSMANIGGKKLISHPFCEYGGPLPLVQEIDGAAFKKDLLEEFKTPFKISFHPVLLAYFNNLGKEESERETYLIKNLHQQTPDELWDKLDRNRHRSIKTALDGGFKIEKCKSVEDLKELYNLYVKNLKNHKTPAYPFSFFEFFFRNPQAEIILVKREGKFIGGNIFLFYGKTVHSFLCGFEDKYKKFGVHSLVIWSEIRKGQKEGMETFDLGAVRKTSSLEDFKQRWGGSSFPIAELKNYAGGSKLKNSFLRDVWGLLPTPLVKFLSPYFIKYRL